jgi:1-acyl-sn-glycerol-3-phosphate acyltransferase
MSIEVTGPLRMTPFWRFIQRVAEFIVLVLFRWRVTVEGLDNVPRGRGAVLVYNHHGYFDFVMVAWNIVRKHRRPPRFLAKRELWDSWKVRWIVNGAKAVPVERGSSTGRHGALDAAVVALRAGDLVAVAPEQTISQSFDLLPLKSGAVRMAQEAGVPIIPVAGWGSHRFSTKGRKPQWAARIPVTVRYGEPITIPPGMDVHAATDHVAATLQALVDEVQRTYPDGTPAGAWWVPARLGGGAPPHREVLRAHRERAAREFAEGRRPGDEGHNGEAGQSPRAS